MLLHPQNGLRLSPQTGRFGDTWDSGLAPFSRGHMFKLYKQRHHTNVGASFFASRVIGVWNYLPENIVDVSSLAVFQRTITLVDFNVFLNYV